MGFGSIAPGLDRVAVPLVHLAGLDLKFPEHKLIHDTLRSAQSAVNYMFVPVDQYYPPCKTKKENLDLFIPQGALKANWMVKQLEVIPSVLCFFVSLEFDDPNMSSKLQEIKSKLDILRMSLQKRKTSITLCLVQRESKDPSQEIIVEMEQAVELNRTSIFILPLKNDHLSGYIQRLQNWLLQLSHNYYDSEIMEVKMRQELNASRMHPLLFCRYLFKLAFYCEIRHLTGDAITFYKHCYSKLASEQVQVTIQNQSQVLAFATLVNFKLVKLYLTIAPWFQRDYAMKQLDKHVHYWSQGTLKGPTELWFEYYAWVANQYRVYGDLLAESSNGLRVNGQAAFYYLKAAKFERDRADFIRQIKAQVLQQECPKDDITARPITYLGERPWERVTCLSI